jgi:hypothetical protein
MRVVARIDGVPSPRKLSDEWRLRVYEAFTAIPDAGALQPPLEVRIEPVTSDARRVLSPSALAQVVQLVLDGAQAANVVRDPVRDVYRIVLSRSLVGSFDAVVVTVSDVLEPF